MTQRQKLPSVPAFFQHLMVQTRAYSMAPAQAARKRQTLTTGVMADNAEKQGHGQQPAGFGDRCLPIQGRLHIDCCFFVRPEQTQQARSTVRKRTWLRHVQRELNHARWSASWTRAGRASAAPNPSTIRQLLKSHAACGMIRWL